VKLPSLAAVLIASGASAAELVSPDGRLKMTIETVTKDVVTPDGGQLVYSVTVQGKPLVDRSALRLELQGRTPLGATVRILGSMPSSADTTWKPVLGKTSQVRDHYNAVSVTTEEPELDPRAPRRRLVVEARAYDDAVAFRYVIPEQAGLRELRVAKESTEFRIHKDATAYAMVLPHYQSMYESEFVELPLSAFSNQGGITSHVLLGLPLLMKVPGTAWMAIMEADTRGWAGMYLTNPSGSWTGHWLESRLSPSVTEPAIAVTGTLPAQSPWRVLMIGDHPGRLVESNVILNLNPPSAVKDTSWIRAGKSSWDWWSGSLGPDGQRAFTTEGMKHYVDFSARAGLEYMLIDSGWSERFDITKQSGRIDVPEVLRYAATKNVKVWLWAHWTAVDAKLEEAFPLFEKWGVAGVKIDFMSRDDQVMTEFYYRVAEVGARHRLMIDYHGSNKPTGIERTYPNVVGYEAVLGMEQSKAGARDNPECHVMLPFTRMLAGPMDYTPGGFDNVTEAEFVPRMSDPMVTGTRAHHLAMYVVYEAPFQMVSDHPSAYEGQPAFDFIKAVPATWDETRVIGGDPGNFITIARRRGREWFVGTMTDWTERDVEIPLGFLGEGRWTAEIYRDAPDASVQPKNIVIETKRVSRAATLRLRLAKGGGAALRIRPQ
jgi:alpha-glucosidase